MKSKNLSENCILRPPRYIITVASKRMGYDHFWYASSCGDELRTEKDCIFISLTDNTRQISGMADYWSLTLYGIKDCYLFTTGEAVWITVC